MKPYTHSIFTYTARFTFWLGVLLFLLASAFSRGLRTLLVELGVVFWGVFLTSVALEIAREYLSRNRRRKDRASRIQSELKEQSAEEKIGR